DGLHLPPAAQPSPAGRAPAAISGKHVITGESCALGLGDPLFYGNGLGRHLLKAARMEHGATVFGYYVEDPERFGVVEIDKHGKAISIEEKPEHPRSNFAVTGLYFYDNRVCEFASNVERSARGEYEITDLNRMYLEEGSLNVVQLGRGYSWFDTGTMDSLFHAAQLVRVVERSQNVQIASLEEIAFLRGWIDRETLRESAERYGKSTYGSFLKRVVEGDVYYPEGEYN
ncbi:MAG: sugar phosphate nucleotidyltransferase, partial [Coriobacteriia bacterium]|nr:sugar phosphate nucleotidyltransferase [Coriobacteriia bacterium]